MKTPDSIRIWGSIVVMLSSLPCPPVSRAQEQNSKAPHALQPIPQPPSLAECSPDGEFYALARADGRIRCGKTHEGAATRTLHQCYPRAMAFSPDSRLLASAGGRGGNPARLKVWQVSDGKLLCKVETGMGRDPVLRFSSDSTLLASSGDGTRINLWQMPGETLRGSLTTGGKPITSIVFSGDCKVVVAVCEDGSVQRFPLP